MINKQLTVRLEDAQLQHLNELYPDLSQKEIFNILFDVFTTPPQQPDNSELVRELDNLKYENEQIEIARTNLTKQVEDLFLQIEQLEARAPQTVEKQVEVEKALAENELLITLPEPCRLLLVEYAKRLETTPENLLIYTFFRYCVERYTMNIWDFSVIKEREFEAICGLPYSEIKKMLKINE
ncbi:MAG: hypothetical protein LBN95_12990 [Prevotellaceae bacterium]|jgi:hypothetical protein|nr:hypothetical protein [Prevotellaceae bacterium]